MNLTKGQFTKLSEFDMIIAISSPNSWNNFFLACNCEKLVLYDLFVNIFDKFFFGSAVIILVGSFF